LPGRMRGNGGVGEELTNFYRDLGVEDVLLIEDDPWSRDSFLMFFRIMECRMQVAANATDAVAAMSRDRFDLILCEYQFSGMNGLTFLGTFGNIQAEAVKVLFTSYPIRKLMEEAARSGIHEVIRKPFSMATLEESLIRYFPRSR
jgi:DNA-binding NtrC family response regulator